MRAHPRDRHRRWPPLACALVVFGFESIAGSGCGGDPVVSATNATVAAPTPEVAASSWSGAAWSSDARRAAVASELARTVEAPAADADDDAWRTYARIGTLDAAAVTVERLANRDASPARLAAIGLLEPLPGRPSEAIEPNGAWSMLERELWTRYAVADSPEQRAALTFAIARIGGSTSARLWATTLEQSPSDTWTAETFDALAIACARRHPLHAGTLEPLGVAIDSPNGPVRVAALGAFARCVAPSAEVLGERAPWVARLEAATASEDPDVARLAWKSIAALGERPAAVPEGVLGREAHASWLVELEAARALAAHAETRAVVLQRLAALPAEAIRGTRAVVVWATLVALRRAIDEAPREHAALATWRDTLVAAPRIDARHARELAIVRCELELLGAVAGEPLTGVERCAAGVDGLAESYGELLAIDALAAMARAEVADVRAQALVDRAKDHRPVVAAAALAAVADLEHPLVNEVVRDALSRADIGVLAAAAGAIAARAPDRARRDQAAVEVIESMLAHVDPVAAMEARIAGIEALGALARSAGQDVAESPNDATPKLTSPEVGRAWLERTVVPLANDPHEAVRRAAWAALTGFDELQRRFLELATTPHASPFADAVREGAVAEGAKAIRGLRIDTDAGTFSLRFEGAPSPIAQAAIAGLADAGYYDDLRFHRIVPGFVAQGGDPRGDGYGGPGWVMPCEWSDLRFERGTVGIALAGKDTGGSQLFVAQTRQPHLDGRFTVIGQVDAGMDVVDRLLPQDRILRIEVVRAP